MKLQLKINLHKYLEKENILNNISHSLCSLIENIAESCKIINSYIKKNSINNLFNLTSNKNSGGDLQNKLDIISNNILINFNKCNKNLVGIASEEIDTFITINNNYSNGKYLIIFDPLDGSSNININISIGTIFSILHCPDNYNINEKSFLQAGIKQIAAGYAIYGPQTMFVFTIKNGVNCFTLDPELGSWILTKKNMKIPKQTFEYSINSSNKKYWYNPVQRYINEINEERNNRQYNQNFNMRWIASMVADIHRILIRGGIFLYPADKRSSSLNGKIRLMYEANPMAYIVENAGGAATNGKERILSIKPKKLHERVPIFIGSKKEVELITQYHLEETNNKI